MSIDRVRDALAQAIRALMRSEDRQFDLAIDQLVQMLPEVDEKGQSVVSEAFVIEISNRLRSLWTRGWQPLDVVRVIARLETTALGEFAAAAIVADAAHDAGKPMHPQWAAQLEGLFPWWTNREKQYPSWLFFVADHLKLSRRTVIEHTVLLVQRLSSLPPLVVLIPPPGPGAERSETKRVDRAMTEVDTKMLSRIRGLLAKAESTEFPDEADSLTQKAQELMTRYSIDGAMINASSGLRSGPGGRRLHLDAPYIDAKASLANQVALANRCHLVLDPELGFVTVFGFAADLDAVELLFTSLLAQATHALVSAGRQRSAAGGASKSFRQSFLVAYAHRIGERLQDAATTSTDEAVVAHGSSVALVLAERDQEVKQAAANAFPKTKAKRSRASSGEGWAAGRTAADRASLSGFQRLDR